MTPAASLPAPAAAPGSASGPAPEPMSGPAPGTSAGAVPPRVRRRRVAAYAAVVTLGVVLLALLAASAARPEQFLDPQGTGPQGGRALAEVLRDQGVEVDVVRSVAALERATVDDATTVFVADPVNVGPGATARLREVATRAGRLVVAGGDDTQLEALRLPVSAYPAEVGLDLVAGCDAGGARAADTATVLDTRYLLDDGAPGTSCFVLPDPGGDPDVPSPDAASGAGLVVVPPGSGRPETLLVGTGPTWTNELVADAGHAGVAVRALGSLDRLVWYQPGTGDLTASGPDGEPGEVEPLWPVWTTPAVVLLGVAVALLALARGRRLGRLVREPLPVVVRAAETTESRGRLYRRARDRGRAAEVLRSGTRERVARRLGLPRRVPFPSLVTAVATHTGTDPGAVAHLLGGAPPADDAALVQLARQLTDLEERLRQP